MTAEEPVELRDRELRGRRFPPTELAAHSELVDLTVAECDVTGLLAQQCRIERVQLTRTRLRSVTWAAGTIRDVVVDDVSGTDVSCRFSTLRRVTIRESQLPGLDLTEATLDDVSFERCDLTGARFDHARLTGVRLAGCDLSGVHGASSLAGASMPLDDVLSLAPSLARAVGITIQA